jgi:hypothetical protein
MPEQQKNVVVLNNYILKKNIVVDCTQFILRISDRVFKFFSLRQSKQFWGIVYDAVSKQPLDPVIVKLLYTDGREVETAVTDLGGRYGFLAKPGKFKIYTRKTNYSFPSKYVTGDHDGIYENLYHGEFFSLDAESEVVGPNIPMDPEKFDWNQQAKQKFMKTHPYLKRLWRKLIAVFFWFGLAFNLVYLKINIKQEPFYLYIIFLSYFIVILLANILPEPRLWGKVSLTVSTIPIEKIFLELHSSLFVGVSFGKSLVHENGRFLLRAAKGKYMLTISYFAENKEKVFLCSAPVEIGPNGVFNSSLIITQE